MKRKNVIVTILLIGMLSLLAGCAKKGKEPAVTDTSAKTASDTPDKASAGDSTGTVKETATKAPEKAAKKSNVTLKFWFCINTDENKALQEIADQYTKETGVKVKVLDSNFFSIRKKFPLAAETKEGPDILYLQSADLGALVETGYLKEINFVDDETRSRFIDVGFKAMTYNGKLYGVCHSIDAYGIVYNKAKITQVPATWGEYFKLAKQNTVGDEHYGTLIAPSNFWFLYPIMKSYGAYYMGTNADGSFNVEDIGLDNAGMVAAVNFFLELKNDGLLLKTYTETDNNISEKFAEGKVDMFIYGLYDSAKYISAGIDFGYAPLPKNDDGTQAQPLSTVHGFAVNAYSKNPEEAEAFLKYILQDENQQKLYEAGNGGDLKTGSRNTCNLSVMNSEYVQSSELLKSLVEVGKTGEIFPTNPEATVLWNSADSALKAIYYNGADVQGKLTELADKVRSDIKTMRNK